MMFLETSALTGTNVEKTFSDALTGKPHYFSKSPWPTQTDLLESLRRLRQVSQETKQLNGLCQIFQVQLCHRNNQTLQAPERRVDSFQAVELFLRRSQSMPLYFEFSVCPEEENSSRFLL